MAYFTAKDHQALSTQETWGIDRDSELQRVHDKLLDLHKALYHKIRNHNLGIYCDSRPGGTICFESAASNSETDGMTISYTRTASDATMVERLMGRENQDQPERGSFARFHPVIELRLTPQCLTVELILSPDAWWDQQNFMGKLSVRRHRAAFYKLIQNLDNEYRLGFWQGATLSDMHLTTGQLAQTAALDEWIGTFEEGRDWFRIGFWYEIDSPELDTSMIVQELFDRVEALSRIYHFIAWTSNNNFRNLVAGHQTRPVYV